MDGPQNFVWIISVPALLKVLAGRYYIASILIENKKVQIASRAAPTIFPSQLEPYAAVRQGLVIGDAQGVSLIRPLEI